MIEVQRLIGNPPLPARVFEWADSLGIEFVLAILEGLHEHYQDDRYRPASLLRYLILTGFRL